MSHCSRPALAPMTEIHHSFLTANTCCLLRHRSFTQPTAPSPSQPLLHPANRSFIQSTAPSSSQPLLHPANRSFIQPTAPSPSPPLLHPVHRSFTQLTAPSPSHPLLHPANRSFTQPTAPSPSQPLLHQANHYLYVVQSAGCAGVVSQVFAHRSRPSMLVQEIKVHNPTVSVSRFMCRTWVGSCLPAVSPSRSAARRKPFVQVLTEADMHFVQVDPRNCPAGLASLSCDPDISSIVT